MPTPRLSSLNTFKRFLSPPTEYSRLPTLLPFSSRQTLRSCSPLPQPSRLFNTSANTTIRTQLTQTPSKSRIHISRTPFRTSISNPRPFRRFNSSNSSPPNSNPGSFSERMRKLSREYGWSALGVYLLLSALDFPFCFMAVRLLGVDRIGHYEHVVVGTVQKALSPIWDFGKRDRGPESVDAIDASMAEEIAQDHRQMSEPGEGASIWTQLALAYAVHKSLIFFRVPLTAAVTPKVVKVLRRWGWDIGKRKPKGG